MTLTSFLLILTGVLLNAAAQLLLKAGVGTVGVIRLHWQTVLNVGWQLALEPHIVGGLGCYVISVCAWILALSRVQVSIAYPMLSIGYVINAVMAWYWLGEPMSPARFIGIGIIIAGVYILARS